MTIDRLRRWLPWPIVLVVVGMLVRAYSAPGALAPFTLDPRVIGYFLPALIFEAAWDFELPLLARTARSIGVLAVPGVLVTTLIVALGARLSGTLAWSSALVLGAIVSATDPIAVLALF
ncbi:MAG TPA: cation:proton antiporter, partial [Candidatus Baltobacteraceae bacterium]